MKDIDRTGWAVIGICVLLVALVILSALRKPDRECLHSHVQTHTGVAIDGKGQATTFVTSTTICDEYGRTCTPGWVWEGCQ